MCQVQHFIQKYEDGNTAACCMIKIVKQSMIAVACNAGISNILCLELVPDSLAVTDGIKRL